MCSELFRVLENLCIFELHELKHIWIYQTEPRMVRVWIRCVLDN